MTNWTKVGEASVNLAFTEKNPSVAGIQPALGINRVTIQLEEQSISPAWAFVGGALVGVALSRRKR